MSDIVIVDNVVKTFGKQNALNGVSIHLKEGEEYSIQGASGSGKSTLLYMLGGLDRPTKGTITVNNQNLNTLSDEDLALYRNQYVGFVFQFHFLLPSMNALQNIYLPARLNGDLTKEITNRVDDLAQKLNVTHILNKFPYELSGGEQQRINLIRALSLSPKLLLCDEPTGNLDSQNSSIVIQLLRTLSKENGSTLIVVTHDTEIGASFKNQLHMKDGKFITL